MKSRERVEKAIHFKKPDRPPISHAILPSAQFKYGAALQEILDSVPEDFGWHLLPDIPPDKLPLYYRKGIHYDEFGTVWKVTVEGRCGIPVEYPISDWSRYDQFAWPEFSAGPPKYRFYSGHMVGKSDDYYARGAWITFFEQMQQLRGFEPLLVDLMENRPEVYRLRDDLLKFNLRWIDRWLKYEYQGLQFADDWGTQDSLMISPRIWRLFFRPVYKEMFSNLKSAGLDVWFHTDGNITEILPDLVELGVDVLNCQVSVIGLETLHEYAGRICFRTDLDRQRILPYASPAKIRQHIFETFDALGSQEGGVIACGEISEDVPLENIRAMYEAFTEYKY